MIHPGDLIMKSVFTIPANIGGKMLPPGDTVKFYFLLGTQAKTRRTSEWSDWVRGFCF